MRQVRSCGERTREEVVSSDNRLPWRHLIVAGLVIGSTLAVDLEIDWMQFVGLAGALVLVALVWSWPDRQGPDEPPL